MVVAASTSTSTTTSTATHDTNCDTKEVGVTMPSGPSVAVANDASSSSSSKPGSHQTNKKKKHVPPPRDCRSEKEGLLYKSGIPTLRSSAHRVKFDIKRRKQDPKPKDRHGKETKTTWLPDLLLKEDVFDYDLDKHDLRGAIIALLQSCDESIVGTFETTEGTPPRLEDFRVPVSSVWRSVNGGCCESAQKYLSEAVASNEAFLKAFDRFMEEITLPSTKARLVASGAIEEETPVTFYYQRPPTMRLQPGPGWAQVKPHNDAEYGHQNGELNFWIPLTDREMTQVDLWSETAFGLDDFHPVPANIGQAISFHGSSCRHYATANGTTNTRVSLDFRIGIEGFFDPFWQMKGTTDDHGRREVTI